MASSWDPAQYDRFRDERQQPFFDLLALVEPRPGMRVVDLGCGTGELTRTLHQRLAAADTLGIDASETMLARSTEFAGAHLEGVDLTRIDASGIDFEAAHCNWQTKLPAGWSCADTVVVHRILQPRLPS